ncbi:MAG TPA: cyanophycin synthetase, partial [Gemmatimonadaceae bacterium]|nr:cyanophycin synthetase [Gemmatimonadaceae bacterium]
CGGLILGLLKGDHIGVEVVDDYAHHPTELRATLTAAREAFPNRRVVAAFQPHLFSRTRDFAADFGDALASADLVFLADIYPAREKPIEGVSSQLIADAMQRRGLPPRWMGPRGDLAAALKDTVQDGDIVITIGAGDVTKTGPELIALLGG